MAETLIKIKRSGTSGNPTKLRTGELAYSWSAGEGGNRLYIGTGAETDGNAANHAVIGGTYFTDMLDHQAGVLTASSAIIVDADKKIDEIKTPKVSNDGVLTIEGTKTVLKNAYVGDETTTIEEFVDGRITDAKVSIEAGTGIEVSTEGLKTTVGLKATGVTAKKYGSESTIPVLTVNAQGQITAVTEENVAQFLKLADGDDNAYSMQLLLDTLKIKAGAGAKVTLNTDNGEFTVAMDDTVAATKTYVDDQDKATLKSAKDYTDEQIPEVITSKVGTQLQAWSAQLDKVAALDGNGLVKRNADGSFVVNKSAVTAGAYTKVTVDADGIVTKGENPTTLAGYGIIDGVHLAGDTLTGKLTYSGIGVDDFDTKDLVSKEYVDRVASGHIPHKACATGSQVNISGTYDNGAAGVGATFTTATKTISGVALAEGDRVILLGQTDKTQNGVYSVTSVGNSVVMTRAVDMDGNPTEEIYQGSSFLIIDGSMQGTIWSLINKAITFGTTEIEFAQTAAPNVYTAGAGVTIAANKVSVNQGATVKVIGGNLEVASGSDNDGKFLVAGANGSAAAWKKIQVSDTEGVVPVNRGGTGAETLAANELVVGNGTDKVKTVAKAEGVLIGSATDAPAFGKADLTKHVGGVLPAANGGTGVANTNTITVSGGDLSLKMTGDTDVTLPATGTLATLNGEETLTNKTISAKSVTVSGNITGSGQSVLSGVIIDGGEY